MKETIKIKQEAVAEMNELKLALSSIHKKDPKRASIIARVDELGRLLGTIKENSEARPEKKESQLWRRAAVMLPQWVVDKIKLSIDKKEKIVLNFMTQNDYEMCKAFPSVQKELLWLKSRVAEAKKKIQNMQIDVSNSNDAMWYKKSVEFNREVNKVLRELNTLI